MAQSQEAGIFAWVFLGTTIGATLVFSLLVALGIINKKDRKYLAQGILIGLVTIPLGTFIGGLAAGFNVEMLIRNLIPTMIISLFIVVGLWKIPNVMTRGFSMFGRLIEILAITGLAAIVAETLTGIVIIPGLAPLEEGIMIVGRIAVFLAGAFPLVLFISRAGKRPLEKFGAKLRINDKSTAGLIASLAHVIPMLSLLKEMDSRGKVINIAFSVSGAFVFGGHLGFVAGIEPDLVFPMVIGKLLGGFTAAALAIFILNRQERIHDRRLNY
jgi:ethanolamine transporter